MAIRGKRTNHPLRCAKCQAGEDQIKVSESQQQKRYAGRPRLHADVRCTNCDWRWWSRNKRALELSRVADAEAYTDANR